MSEWRAALDNREKVFKGVGNELLQAVDVLRDTGFHPGRLREFDASVTRGDDSGAFDNQF